MSCCARHPGNLSGPCPWCIFEQEKAQSAGISGGDNALASANALLAISDAAFSRERDAAAKFREEARGMHESYLRLRSILGALHTPPAPTPEEVWELTETKAREVVELATKYMALCTALEEPASCLERGDEHPCLFSTKPDLGGLITCDNCGQVHPLE